jgi:integrase
VSEELFDIDGRRKYLVTEERQAVLRAARACRGEVETLCTVLVLTGCRLSEALAVTAGRLDRLGGCVVFESLKKRRRGQYRAVPVPEALFVRLEAVHGVSGLVSSRSADAPLWPVSRVTAWRQVRTVMAAAGVVGPQATPRGLRHGFGVAAISAGVPLNLVQRWLGHSDISTTAIYANVMGAEERRIAARMWAWLH